LNHVRRRFYDSSRACEVRIVKFLPREAKRRGSSFYEDDSNLPY
jgi:hypothetical protein